MTPEEYRRHLAVQMAWDRWWQAGCWKTNLPLPHIDIPERVRNFALWLPVEVAVFDHWFDE